MHIKKFLLFLGLGVLASSPAWADGGGPKCLKVGDADLKFKHTFQVDEANHKVTATIERSCKKDDDDLTDGEDKEKCKDKKPICEDQEVNLVSYSASGPDWGTSRPQKLFASAGAKLGNEKITLTVTIPDCYYQADLVFGEVLEELTEGGPVYGDRKVSAKKNSKDEFVSEGVQSWKNGGEKTCSCSMPSPTPTSTPTETPFPTPTSSPTGDPSPTPTPTPTSTPTGDPTPTPTSTPTGDPSPTPMPTPTGDPSSTPSPTPSGDPSPTPSSTPTGDPSPSPTPTSSPSGTPTGDPSGTPTNPADPSNPAQQQGNPQSGASGMDLQGAGTALGGCSFISSESSKTQLLAFAPLLATFMMWGLRRKINQAK